MDNLENLIVDIAMPTDALEILSNYLYDELEEYGGDIYKCKCIIEALKCVIEKIKSTCSNYQDLVDNYYATQLSNNK